MSLAAATRTSPKHCADDEDEASGTMDMVAANWVNSLGTGAPMVGERPLGVSCHPNDELLSSDLLV